MFPGGFAISMITGHRFSEAKGPAPGYAMSLREDRRNVLGDRIRSQLTIGPDGTLQLIARAWAVRERTPH